MAIIQGGETRPHTEACRGRMEEHMKATPEGQARLKKAKDRLDEECGAHMEKLLTKEESSTKRPRVESEVPPLAAPASRSSESRVPAPMSS